MGSKGSEVPLFADLNDADPAVVEAVNEARRTFPLFLDAVSTKRFAQASYLIKVPFVDRSKVRKPALVRTPETAAENAAQPTCHLWLSVTSVMDDLIFCSVGEAPDALQLKRGDRFVLTIESIEDWMVNHGGTAYGGFSLRVIRSRLRKDEQMKFDLHTGIREFRTLKP